MVWIFVTSLRICSNSIVQFIVRLGIYMSLKSLFVFLWNWIKFTSLAVILIGIVATSIFLIRIAIDVPVFDPKTLAIFITGISGIVGIIITAIFYLARTAP